MAIENLFTPDCIRTFTGKYMNVFEPTLDMICIEDIAHALSMQPRFGGHLPVFYSVAEHCYHCSTQDEIADHESGHNLRLHALLHDASEAYLLDIPRPIKLKLSNYKHIEGNLMSLIAKKFDIMWPVHNAVHRVDEKMLEIEWQELMLQRQGVKKIFVSNNAYYGQKHAELVFLKRFYELTKK